jgi:hypothetical protein
LSNRESGQTGFEQQPLGLGKDQIETLPGALLRRLVGDRSRMEPGFHPRRIRTAANFDKRQ